MSVLGSTFDGRIVERRTGERTAIVPAIRGSAWITGVTQVFVDPDDPFPEGYLQPIRGASAGSTSSSRLTSRR